MLIRVLLGGGANIDAKGGPVSIGTYVQMCPCFYLYFIPLYCIMKENRCIIFYDIIILLSPIIILLLF